MSLDAIAHRLKKKLSKREQRRIVKQWWDDGGDKHLRYNYDLNADSVVLDLGGFEGQWASDIYARHRCRIFVFEPVKRYADEIAARFRKNDDIEIFQYGLGGKTKTEMIYMAGAGTSAYRKRSESEEIRIVDVKDWFEDHQIGAVALMKINTEGGEFELLERLIDTDLIGSIDNIQVQFHNIALDSARRMEAIQKNLAKTHTPTYQYRFVWENWTRKNINGG